MANAQIAKYKGKEVVVQGNELIEMPHDLRLQEYKLFLFLISKIDPQTTDQSLMFRVSVKEFAKAAGEKNLINAYRDFRKVVRRLMSRVVTIDMSSTPKKKIIDMTVAIYGNYEMGEGYAEIGLNPYLTPYLTLLKRQFTKYKLSNIVKLTSRYAIRTYELLKEYESVGERTFLIEDLRQKLGVREGTFKYFWNFRRKVLEISRREINDKTDLEIDYELRKTGRKITDVVFSIEEKREERRERIGKTREAIAAAPFNDGVKDFLRALEDKIGVSAFNDYFTSITYRLIENKGSLRGKRYKLRVVTQNQFVADYIENNFLRDGIYSRFSGISYDCEVIVDQRLKAAG